MNVDIAAEVSAESKRTEKNYFLTGIWLVVIGVGWLLYNTHFLNWAWMERYGLITLGAISLLKTLYLKKYQIFWSVALILTGVFHLYLDQSNYGMRMLWPMYFLIAGLAWFLNFCIRPSRWISLAAGLITTTFGGLYLTRAVDLLSYEWIAMVRTYWPLTFVMAGIILLAVALIRKRKITDLE